MSSPRIVEVKGNEATINSTASSFSNASCIRVYLATGTSVITITDLNDGAIGNTTIDSGVSYFKKHPTDKIAASVDVLGTPVAFIG